MNKNELFESVNPARALSVMALPTIGSQVIVLLYNLADTWFIGRTNNPYIWIFRKRTSWTRSMTYTLHSPATSAH